MTVAGREGAVASETAYATEAGIEMLRRGGSAADAIIATQLCVGVVQSSMSGIGGGGFALVRQPSGEYETLDFRIAAPLAVRAEMYEGKDLTVHGGMSVGTPGDLRGMEALHSSYGKLPWATCFEPAIALARDGYPCSETVHWAIRRTLPPHAQTKPEDQRSMEKSWIFDYPELKAMFCKDGQVVPIGTLIKRPALAQTLETLAEKGADAFYHGEIAKGMVDAVQQAGGLLALSDFSAYQCRRGKALSINYKGKKVLSTPVPSSGSVVLNALNTLSNFDSPAGPETPLDSHRMIESFKFAYANRTKLGDPAFVKGMDDLQVQLTSKESGERYYGMIDQKTTHADPAYYNEARIEIKSDNGTSHMVAADKDGLVISLTTTITLAWGSRIVVPSSGIVLNDGMSDFAVKGASNFFGYVPSESNFIAGGKRPLSSTSPFMIEDGKGSLIYAGGSMGGSRIISSNVQHARNVLDYGMSPAEALDHPRLHNQLQPEETLLEDRHSQAFQQELEKYGHKIRRIQNAEAVACGIARDPKTGQFFAAGEPRLPHSAGLTL